jgi:hypothetical protein
MSVTIQSIPQGGHTPFHDIGSQVACCHISQLLNKQASVPLQQLLLAPKSLVAESMTDHLPLPSVRYVIRPEDAWWVAMNIRSVEHISFLEV